MKNLIRETNKKIRREMIKSEVAAKSAAASLNFLETDIYKNANLIMAYMPLGNETDTADIIKQSFADGKKVALPVTNQITGEIAPHIITEKTKFKPGAFSVDEPTDSQIADLSEIDVVIVPGIAFDRTGNRVGFGKGCYDMFLQNSRAIKAGFCYEFQLADEIPADKHDIKMDYVITENKLYKCNNR